MSGPISKALDLAAKVERLDIKAGDLLVVRCDADTPEEVEALRSVLEPLSHALDVRVVALPEKARLEVVEGDLLADLAVLTHSRLEGAGDWQSGGVSRETMGRIIAEAAGELGLVILKPERAK